MRKSIVAIITVILCVFFSGCGASFDTLESMDFPTNNNSTSKRLEAATETQPIIESNIDILLRANHPKWLDDADTVYTIWSEEISSGKIVLPDAWETIYGDDHILEITSYGDDGDEHIGAIIFHFYNMEETVTLETALEIIDTYLPEDIIQKYYYEERSYYEINDDVINIYVKSYRLINESDSDIERVSTTFDILIWVDENGNVTEAKIDNVAFAKFDEEIMHNWDYNFFTE